MAVVMQPAFVVVILALKTQGIADVGDVECVYVAVSAVAGRPDDYCARVGQLQGRAERVELIVEN